MPLRSAVKGMLRRLAGGLPEGVRTTLVGVRPGGRSPRESQEAANRFWNEAHRRDSATRAGSQAAADPLDYTRHPFLYRHSVSEPLTGDPDRFWLDEIGIRYLAPSPGRLLSLGCGIGHAEEHLVSRGYASEIVAYDASPGAIEEARARLAGTPWASRVDFRCGTGLDDGHQPQSFDAVFVEAALHHFIRLEEVFAFIHRVLRPGGTFVFDEYVGPDYQVYPAELVGLLNRVNECLADRYRRDFETGELRTHVGGATPEYIMANDPTEAVHSSQILPLTYCYFHVIDRRDYGGALVRPLFCRVVSGWDLSDPRDQTVARMLILLERELTERGILPTHNSVVVARPRARPRPPLGGGKIERIAYADWPGLRGERRVAEPPER
jgi:SAM-dependent methyltransferase